MSAPCTPFSCDKIRCFQVEEDMVMKRYVLSRRLFLERGLHLPLGGLLVAAASGGAVQAAEKACVDLNALDGGQRGLRESLIYVDQSKTPNRTCGNCGFFEAKGDGCGHCMIFEGPASASGHCDAWSAKE